MWYPAAITVAAAAEPISLAQARTQCRVESDESYYDDDLNMLIKAARAYVESYCGVRFASQTVAIKCDGFGDFARLPEAPVSSVSSVSYIDTTGDTQTLATSVYELRGDGLDAAIVLKYNQSWPSIQPGSRITVTAVVGHADAPDDVIHALLLYVAEAFAKKENFKAEAWTVLDCLLSNHRRGA